MLVCLVFYIKRIIFVFKTQKIKFSLVKERLGFILNNYVILNAVLLNGHIDTIIIAPLLGFVMLGNYSLGLQFIAPMLIFSRFVYQYILSQDSSGNNTKNLKLFAQNFVIKLKKLRKD